MGRLFWRILLVFWAVLLILGLGIGYGVHLYFQSRHRPAGAIAAGPRAEIIVRLTDGMLEGNSRDTAVRTLKNWQLEPGPLPLVVDTHGVDLLGRSVEQSAYREARQLVEREGERSVRRANTSDGMTWIIYTPSMSLHEPPEPDGEDRPAPGLHHGPPPPFWDFRFSRFELFQPLFATLPAIITSLAVSAWLARSLSRRVQTLREGFEAVADGDFETRLANRMGGQDEIAELGRDFDRMAERLENLVGAQRRLLYDVSHELRSPLARLQVAVGLARQQPERSVEVLARIERESERLDSLVGELLTLSRLESGSGMAREDHVDLVELLRTVTDDAGFESEPAGVGVLLSGDTEQELILRAHGELLHRAFDNVVRNAVRYSPHGAVVDVRLTQAQDSVTVIVADRGRGLPESSLASVFDAFVRGPESDGYGLGLAIARRSVEAHGGQIVATNRVGGGLEIWITLPKN
jgi:two-component system OmpR family sensor kinase